MVTAFVMGMAIALPNMDMGAVVIMILGTSFFVIMEVLAYKNPYLTDEQKKKLKKIAVVLGAIALICFLVSIIFWAVIRITRA